MSKFKVEKLIFPNLAANLFTVFDDEGFYTNQKCFIITSEDYNLKFLSCLLSSKLLNFIFKFLGTPLQGNYYDLNKKFVEMLPIYPTTLEQQQPFIENANQMLKINNQLKHEFNSFKDWLKHTFGIETLSQKLNRYNELSFEEFLNEVKKKKVNIKSRENYQTLKEEFENSIVVINPLLQKIEDTDKDIDMMVYDLYGLNTDEIEIIEKELR